MKRHVTYFVMLSEHERRSKLVSHVLAVCLFVFVLFAIVFVVMTMSCSTSGSCGHETCIVDDATDDFVVFHIDDDRDHYQAVQIINATSFAKGQHVPCTYDAKKMYTFYGDVDTQSIMQRDPAVCILLMIVFYGMFLLSIYPAIVSRKLSGFIRSVCFLAVAGVFTAVVVST